MAKKRITTVKLAYFRSLMSQSAASLTMGSIAALLRENGIGAEICLFERGNPHNLEQIFAAGEVIIIAKPNFKDISEMIKLLQFAKTDKAITHIFFCGPYASLNAESIMEKLGWLDGIIYGLPEMTSLALLRSIQERGRYGFIGLGGGLWRDEKAITNSAPTSVAAVELDELPFPARDIEEKEDVGFVNIEASRGCDFGCSFCHLPPICMLSGGKKTSERSPNKVVDEIELLNTRFSKKLFIFNDSCFWRTKADDERLYAICDEIAKRRLKIHIYAYLRCNPFISDELLSSLRKAGLTRVFIGLENMTKEAQRSFNKIIDPNSFGAIRDKLERAGIAIHIGFMAFEPTATIDGIIANLDYLHSIGQIFRLGVILEPMRVVPGTVMHRQLISNGLIDAGLPFDKITYGYRFKHPNVGNLHAFYREMFDKKVGAWVYNFEYWCVTADFLKKLLEVDGSIESEVLNKLFDDFGKKMNETMELLRSGLIAIAEYFRDDAANALPPDGMIDDFAERFIDFSARIGVIHSKIAAEVKKTTPGVLREIYSGLERI